MRQLINLSALKSLLKSIIIASRLLGSHSIFSVIVISRIDWLEILYAYSLSQPSSHSLAHVLRSTARLRVYLLLYILFIEIVRSFAYTQRPLNISFEIEDFVIRLCTLSHHTA